MALATYVRARSALLGVAVIVAAVAFAGGPVVAAKTTLTVYTAVEADDLKKYAARFNEDHPDLEIKWVRDSTGVITAKLLAEKANPQADVIWGLAATSLLVLKPEGMLVPYAPKGLERLDTQFRDKDNPPAWVGMDAWVAALCFNTVEAQKKNLPKPASWKDLIKPVYKGTIVMPNPASSGTGFLDVTSWIQLFGEAEGWKYMDALHQNIGVYTHSGSKPCTMAGAGEYPIGISFEFRAARQKNQGAPIDIVIPSEGSGDAEGRAYLRIERLTKQFGAFTALADISLEIHEGEFVCFLGPSGCGKTTLLRAIAGLEIQTSGRIEQAGRDISALPPSKRDFGIVFQSYALFPNLTAAANVAYGLENTRAPKVQVAARVRELLDMIGMGEQGGKYPAQLSGGQQQRVALA